LGMKRTSLLYRMKKLRIRRTAMLRENLGGAAASD